ncbi:uncharacterized protein LOC134534157 [Bacillus rossius redtenbacheri]|uniref:uncharacterized protein LOC134534157 n=1 Tax=Bacillus rossius redtenbacheri TaxID=93214 RepID=UPI002FDDB8B3
MSLQVEAAVPPPPLAKSRRPRGPRPAAHRRKRATPPATQKTASGLYVYSNPPRVLNMNPSVIRQWLRGGELDRLQQVVLEGQGHKLVGEYSPDPKVRAFLKTVPSVMASMETLHDLVSKDDLEGVRRVLERDLQVSKGRALALCKDQSGAGLLHKAVCRDNLAAARLLLEFNPAAANLKDKEGRTALHYCCRTSAPEDCWALLTAAGADQGLVDSKGRTAAYYLDHPEEASPAEARHVSAAMKRFTSGKGGFVVTKANIRIWIHDRDLGRLQQMLWEGHGNKLRVETSNNPRVKRFLDAVPYIMGTIRDVHAAAVSNDVATFKKKTADPVPGAMLCSKDQNGLNPLHKAAGLGHTELVEYILERNPKAANMTDNDGKLPLHYAAAVKDDGSTYNLLAGATADERALDNRGKFPGYYRLKPGEADPGARLRAVPDAPRTASTFPPAWDWRLLNNMAYDFGPVSAAQGDDSGHEAGHSASEDTLPGSDRSKTLGDDSNFGTQSSISEMQEESSHIEAGYTKLGPGNEGGKPPIEEDEGMGGDVEENEQQEAEDQELAVEESGDQGTAAGRGDEQTAGSDMENGEEAAVEEAEGRAADEEDADQEPASLRPEQDERETAGQDDEAVRDAETGECEVKDSSEATGEEEPGAAQVDRWARDEDGGGGDAGQTPASDAASDPDHAQLLAGGEEEQAGGGEGPVETDAPEEQIDESATDERSNEEEDVGEEVKTETKEEEVRRLIDGGNMGELAAMILDGEGYRLVGRASSDPELQGFLNNVPVYMRKISAVHAAAREGRLRDLQAALDRRKFAVARDGASSLGATPLHVATLFGHTSVVRYLAGRFPETLAARDLLGRAPLHYAAAVRDNGHFYHLLLGLGADPDLADHLGNTPEYYQQNPDALSHQQLLKEYGASETTADILADKGDPTARSDSRDEVPVIWTDEGRYLASALGQPLMKGLTEIATTRPRDPIAYLAAYLYNYANRNKSRVGTQESRVLLTSAPGVEAPQEQEQEQEQEQDLDLDLDGDDAAPPSPDIPGSAFAPTERDEHGQSMLHFAAARTHGRGALLQLLDEAQVNPGCRDALGRTARDVALQARLPENARDIDRWVLFMAARGETEKLLELMLEGYDHILDVTDEDNRSIIEVVAERSLPDTQAFLQSIAPFEERREQLHEAARAGDLARVRAVLLPGDGGKATLLAVGKSRRGRTCLHVAVLRQREPVVQFLAGEFPQTLRLGDNLERTPLHYAMGLEKFESISTILIKAGAKRVAKDLKGRQPTYYFMNKLDIVKLQEEEEELEKSE